MKSFRNQQGFLSYNVLVGIAVVAVISLVLLFGVLKYETVEGNYAAVKETWDGGVQKEALPPKTYWIYRWTEELFHYDMSGQVFVMNDKGNDTHGEGRRFDALEIKSSDNQKVVLNVTLQWHRAIDKLADMHRQYRTEVEEKLIRPNIVRVLIAHATVKPALELYSGKELVDLQKQVEEELKKTDGPLHSGGVIVDSFVIDYTHFPDTKYVENIEARQRALIAESRFLAEQKTNQAEADAAKIAALKKQYQDVVEAETKAKKTIIDQQAESDKATIQAKADALNAITRQEAESQKIVLQAKADAEKAIALADADKQKELFRAVGIEAVGRAEAEANKLKLASYSAPGSDNYVKVEVAKQFASGLANVRFFPSNATYNTIAKDFDSGLSLLVGGNGTSVTTPVTK